MKARRTLDWGHKKIVGNPITDSPRFLKNGLSALTCRHVSIAVWKPKIMKIEILEENFLRIFKKSTPSSGESSRETTDSHRAIELKTSGMVLLMRVGFLDERGEVLRRENFALPVMIQERQRGLGNVIILICPERRSEEK